MKFIEFCVRYPVTVICGALLAVLFGGVSLLRIPVQMTPTVERPEISVETTYRGAAPLEVEQEVTDREEERLNSVESLLEVTSTSAEGKSTIVLTFDWGVNKDVARLDVAEKMGLVKGLPDDADEPLIRAVNTDEEQPIAWLILQTGRDLNEVRLEAEDVIQPRLERVPGVGAVWLFGGQEREVQVLLDAKALGARGLSISQVRDVLLRENRNIKGGHIDEGKRRYVIRTVGQFTDLREVENVVLARQDSQTVYLRDVAKIRFGHKDPDFIVRNFGTPTIGFGVLRKSGANTVEVMEGVKNEIAFLNDRVYQGKDIQLVQVYDETIYIDRSIRNVLTNLLYGGLLAIAVLLIFLRSPSSTLIIAFAIPLSLVTTFIFFSLLGRSLNTISLAGLAFAGGIVVDNSIVVLENIFRHRQEGKGRFEAALQGATEVWGAVLASTLTTLAVFLPILFVQDEAGQLFRDIAISISAAVGISLIVSLTVIPMLSSRILRVGGHAGGGFRRLWDWVGLGGVGRALRRALLFALAWLMRGVVRRVALVLLLTLGGLATAYSQLPPLDYLPQGNRNLIFGLVKIPPGFNLEQKGLIVRELEDRFVTMPELKRVFSAVRQQDPIFVIIVKDEFARTPSSMRQVVAELRQRSQGVAGTSFVFLSQSSLFRRRGAFIGGTNLEVNVKGDELEEIQRISEQILSSVRRLPQVGFVNTSFELGNPELQVRVDRERASDLGLSVDEMGYVVETLVKGTEAGKFRERGREIDITLKGEDHSSLRTQDLGAFLLYTPAGRPIQVSDVAQIRPASGPTKVDHTDLDRSIRLTVNIQGNIPMETAIQEIEQEVVGPIRSQLPLGYTIDVSGQAKDLFLTWNALKWSFLLALIIIYLLMASLFESFIFPFIIMFSVPLALTGGVLAVKLANVVEQTVKLDVLTMLGFFILAGIVVNNAILLVHQALNLMREGMPHREAILESARTRFRPIFMTTATTVFGMLPLVVRPGAGSELYRGLGAAILGGLSLSALFTLLLVPTLFSLWLDFKEGMRTRLGKANP